MKKTQRFCGIGMLAEKREPDCLENVLKSKSHKRRGYCTGRIQLDSMYFFLFFDGTLYYLNFRGDDEWEECGIFLGTLVEKAIVKMDNADAEKLWSWFLEFDEKYGIIKADTHCQSLRTWMHSKNDCAFFDYGDKS